MDKKDIVAFDILYNHFFVNKKTMKHDKFVKILPMYLKRPGTKLYTEYISQLPAIVTKEKLLEIFKYQNNGYEYQSFYFFTKLYRPNLTSNLDLFDSNVGFNYRGVKQEALYIYILLDTLHKHSFIRNYVDNPLMRFIFQDKIELDILPSTNQYKFDLCFKKLNIILEINEYAHESDEKKMEDDVKACYTVLCGMSLSSLKVFKVFEEMPEADFKKLSNDELHQKFKESIYLKDFVNKFCIKVLAALLTDDIIRNDYIMHVFKNILSEKLLFLLNRYNARFAKTGVYPEKDKILIREAQAMITTVTSSDNFIKTFLLKDKCVKADSGRAITFGDILDLLEIDVIIDCDKIDKLITFLLEDTDIIDDTFNKETHRFSWEDLYMIVTRYTEIPTNDKITLEMYLLYVGKTYENVINLTNSHYKGLVSDKDKVTKYMNHFEEKFDKTLLNENKKLNTKKLELIAKINKLQKKIKYYENYFTPDKFDKDLNYTSNYMVYEEDPDELLENKIAKLMLQCGDSLIITNEVKKEIKPIIADSDSDSESE